MTTTFMRNRYGTFPVTSSVTVSPRTVGRLPIAISRTALMNAYTNGTDITIPDRSKPGYPLVTGKVSALLREDGSGHSHMVTLYGHVQPFHVVTM